MSMSLDALVVDLGAALGDAAGYFTDGERDEFPRLLETAAGALAQVRPRRRAATLTLVAEQADYTAPADLLRVLAESWGAAFLRDTPPWESAHPGRLPRASVAEGDAGRILRLQPPPSATQITWLGASWPYVYAARHVLSVTAADTTVPAAERELLLERAAIDAVRELATAGTRKPVQLHKGVGNVAASGTPAELWPALLEAWERRARQ